MPQCVNPGCRRETGDRLVCLNCGTPVPPNAAEPLLEAASGTSRRYIIPVFDAASGLDGSSPWDGCRGATSIFRETTDKPMPRHPVVQPGGRLTLEDQGSMNGTW